MVENFHSTKENVLKFNLENIINQMDYSHNTYFRFQTVLDNELKFYRIFQDKWFKKYFDIRETILLGAGLREL